MIPRHREPTHPGVMLLKEFLEPLGMTQVEAAAAMKISVNRLNEIIRRRRHVTADSAIRFAKLFGTTPEFWMNLQTTWDIYHAMESISLQIKSIVTSSDSVEDSAEVRTEAKAWSVSLKWLEALTYSTEPQKLEASDTQLSLAA